MLSAKDDCFLHSIQPFFTGWYMEDILGEGSSGTVYRITDRKGNHCALKVIVIITPDDGALSFEEQDFAAKKACLEEQTNAFLAEIKVLQTLKNLDGIVNCEEYTVVDSPGGDRRFVLMRMALLQPLNKVLRMREAEFTGEETADIGIDLLTALSQCRLHHIIHRDIKPSNIFVTGDNRYLLGDFGSARLLEKTMMASHKGTLAYMAPEIAAGKSFNSAADIYSLGIVLYQLLNCRRLPFLTPSFQFADIELAVEKRLSGVLLPCPENADEELGAIICKMCAYSPKERYASPEECLADLQRYRRHEKLPSKKKHGFRFAVPGLLLLVMLLFTANALRENPDRLPIPGITSGNVNSPGTIAGDGDWLYYSQDTMGQRGIKISRDKQQKKILCDYTMHDINVTEDYLVFSSRYTVTETDKNHSRSILTGLYRMEKDGSNLTCLDDSTVYNPVVYAEYVYYLRNSGDANILCRIPLAGGEAETLAEFNSFTFNFYPFGQHLYVYDKGEKRLIALNLGDGKKTIVIDQPVIRFCIENGFLYYQLPEPDGFSKKLYVHAINPSAPDAELTPADAVTFPYGISEFNVSSGVIYAVSDAAASEEEPGGIWRVNAGGTPQKIYSGSAAKLQIVDGTLYFKSDTAVYSMEAEGGIPQEIEHMTAFYSLD
ncbi:MAG: DUF5050 domain-containing protein [Bacteroidales bacterium]|nr:DUF5050 domain-containing protein [Clostridium sp.]MCM1204541.1 DUF5050 domain-containing protein [Bacteroidales bacterium]